MSEDLASQLIDARTGLYHGWEQDGRVDLYQCGIGWPLLARIVDGFGVAASWKQALGASKSETLFQALRYVSTAWKAFYIKHHDEVFAELDWALPLDDSRISPRLFQEFNEGCHSRGPCRSEPGTVIWLGLSIAQQLCRGGSGCSGT